MHVIEIERCGTLAVIEVELEAAVIEVTAEGPQGPRGQAGQPGNENTEMVTDPLAYYILGKS